MAIFFCEKSCSIQKFFVHLQPNFNYTITMINRTVHMIFEPSGQPIPSEEEVQFEAQELAPKREKFKKVAYTLVYVIFFLYFCSRF